MNIAETPELFKHKHYQDIREVVQILNSQNLLQYGAGFCLAVADLVQNMLNERGIKSSLCEVQLTITHADPPHLHVVGLQTGELLNGQLATHVVVITEDEKPLLIDLSIANQLLSPFTHVIAPLSTADGILSQIDRYKSKLVYREKVGAQFPAIHQKNIKERIELDKKFDRSIKQNKQLAVFLLISFIVIILLTAYDLIMTWHLNTLANRNYERILQIESVQQNQLERASGTSKRIDRLDERANKSSDRDILIQKQLEELSDRILHLENSKKK